MPKSLLTLLTLLVFFFSIFLFIQVSNQLLKTKNQKIVFNDRNRVSGKNIASSPIDNYYAASSQPKSILASVGKADSRPLIINNFLSRNNSPMKGLGNVFVKTADKYNLDYRLLPAIAFQESTLGKRVPSGSHNAFGWAVYTGKSSGATFKNWEMAIDSVAKGLKNSYIDRGFTSVEAIMTRYTPDSDGSWAFGVNFAMQEMVAN